MSHVDEHQAIEQVCARLSARFPTVPAETVRRVVSETHQALDGPVRDYVPVLVERGARERLARGDVGAHPALTLH